MPVSMVVVHLKVLGQTFAQMVQMVLDITFANIVGCKD